MRLEEREKCRKEMERARKEVSTWFTKILSHRAKH